MNKKGKFNKNKEFLLIHIYNLCKFGKQKSCRATTEFLTGLFFPRVSTRSIYNYLKALKEEGKIEVKTSGLRHNGDRASIYKLRTISIKCEEPRASKTALEIHRNKKYTKAQKFEETRKVINATQSGVSIQVDLLNFGDNIQNHMDYEKQRKEDVEKITTYEKEQEEINLKNQYEVYTEVFSQKILDTIYRDKTPPEGSKRSQLVWCATEDYKKRVKDLDVLVEEYRGKLSAKDIDEMKYENKINEFKMLAENTSIENNTWKITIFLGGEIPEKINFFDYVTFTPDSEDFRLFKDIYAATTITSREANL